MASGDITTLLHRWKQGEQPAFEELISATYERLRGIADAFIRRESPGHTLQATGLVHELYLMLLHQRKIDLNDRTHFYSLAASLMRMILRDRARSRSAGKRGGAAVRVPLSDELDWVDAAGADMLDLDRALGELEALDARKVRLVELKYFLGCSTDEAAECLGISKPTADRDLRFTKAWLYNRLKTGGTVKHEE